MGQRVLSGNVWEHVDDDSSEGKGKIILDLVEEDVSDLIIKVLCSGDDSGVFYVDMIVGVVI